MKKSAMILGFLILVGSSGPLFAAEKKLTVIHTNDMHSHFLGSSPNIDYTPATTGDDQTLGGWARLATLIKTTRQGRNHPVLVLDGGDFLMGTLFHMLSREQAFELRLLHMMGYDAVTLGNHEFDLKPRGLARILTTARVAGEIPPLVFSNAVFDPHSDSDDSLQALFEQGIVKPYRIVAKDGLRIGIFGLLGKDAAEVAPFASPVSFDAPVPTAQKMVAALRQTEKVDLVICLSHSGLSENGKDSEDAILAQEVDGIDIIISAHTHTKTNRVLRVNNTIIVQAWEYGKQAGILDVALIGGKVTQQDYRAVELDDAIEGDAEISRRIDEFIADVDRRVLAAEGLSFSKRIAETDFDLTLQTAESNLGNLIADAMRWYIDQNDPGAAGKVDVAVISNGVIRDPIVVGKTGQIAVCDAFRALPLGIGFDESETMGYPLIAFYVYPAELKKTFEILTSIYPLKGSDYYIQISGARFTYNPNRMIFDRVTEIWLGDEENGYRLLDYSKSNRTLLRIAADIYNATFLKVIGNFTWHVLDIFPKDRNGSPIEDLKTVRIDADQQTPGIQELKEWKAVLKHLAGFADTDADGLPNVPAKYRGPLGRNVVEASWNPYKLLKRGTTVTWLAFGALLLGLFLIGGIVWFAAKKLGVQIKSNN